MAQYIDKSALVAEIKARISSIEVSQKAGMIKKRDADKKIFLLKSVLTLIDTLEVEEVDIEKDVRQILSLYYEGIKHYEDIIKEEREENGGSDLAIKIMDGVVDARELGIQYVIDKLKAQKGEKI